MKQRTRKKPDIEKSFQPTIIKLLTLLVIIQGYGALLNTYNHARCSDVAAQRLWDVGWAAGGTMLSNNTYAIAEQNTYIAELIAACR